MTIGLMAVFDNCYQTIGDHNMRHIHIFAILGIFIGVVLFLTKTAWYGWVSPDYTAKNLVNDDGKGPIFWFPAMAKFWGHKMYDPLERYTNGFVHLTNVTTYTLLDILEKDDPKNVNFVYPKLAGSKSSIGNLLGCFAVIHHILKADSVDECKLLVIKKMGQEPDIYSSNVAEIKLALEMVGRSPIRGAEDVIDRILKDEKVGFWVKVKGSSCLALLPKLKFCRTYRRRRRL